MVRYDEKYMALKFYKITRSKVALFVGAVAALFGFTVSNDLHTVQRVDADTPYSQSGYYGQGSYYSQGTYYSQSGYGGDGCGGDGGGSGGSGDSGSGGDGGSSCGCGN